MDEVRRHARLALEVEGRVTSLGATFSYDEPVKLVEVRGTTVTGATLPRGAYAVNTPTLEVYEVDPGPDDEERFVKRTLWRLPA